MDTHQHKLKLEISMYCCLYMKWNSGTCIITFRLLAIDTASDIYLTEWVYFMLFMGYCRPLDRCSLKTEESAGIF